MNFQTIVFSFSRHAVAVISVVFNQALTFFWEKKKMVEEKRLLRVYFLEMDCSELCS